MRLDKARIEPVEEAEASPELREVLRGLNLKRPIPNILMTFAQTPGALATFGPWSMHVLRGQSVLPPRQREIIILRIGYLCRSGYEFAQHTRISQEAGVTADEIARIKHGAEAGWAPVDAALIRACDEIVANHFISEPLWLELARSFDETQLMYIVYTAAQYVQISILLNTFGVQLEPSLKLDPDLQA